MEENELRNDNVKIKVEKPKKIKERKRGNSLIASIITFFIGAVCMYLFVYMYLNKCFHLLSLLIVHLLISYFQE